MPQNLMNFQKILFWASHLFQDFTMLYYIAIRKGMVDFKSTSALDNLVISFMDDP